MNITKKFSNDPIWVQQLQEELYWSLVSLPYELAKALYLKAENTLNIETRLGIDCSKVKKTDKDKIKQEWIQYFREKIEFLLDIHCSLPRSIVLAATYPDPDIRGLEVESQMDLIVNELYSQIRVNEENLISERLSLHSKVAFLQDR